MVKPVSQAKTVSILRHDRFIERIWKTQAKPYTIPLDHTSNYCRLLYSSASFGTLPSGVQQVGPADAPQWLLNEAYERFVKRVNGETSSLLTSVAEYHKARDMVISRAFSLFHAARMVRKFQFKSAYRELFHANSQVGRKIKPYEVRSKDQASAWLELSYGWAPLYGDIASACKVLTGPMPMGFISARSSKASLRKTLWSGNPATRWQYIDYAPQITCGARVWLSNPNTNLAGRMGFLNPVNTAWELLPWSFLVDHFLDVGNYLRSFTDFAGLKLEFPYTTTHIEAREYYWDSGNLVWDISSEKVFRQVGSLPKVRPEFKPLRGLSLKRGADYVALLSQQLRSF